ncbi:MAG: hypothetical protein JNL58_19185 [Planctomyces sp.]|nr:hypothetical protein [Planctomyces sp.]
MKDPRIPFRNPFVALGFAVLFPGGGHWYQGRRFKATIYTVCILAIFIWGMVLGNLQPVYSQTAHADPSRGFTVQMEKGRPTMSLSVGFVAQALIGGPAFPSILQQERFRQDPGVVERLDGPLESDFQGVIRVRGTRPGSITRAVTGTIQLKPVKEGGSSLVTGTLEGTYDDGTDAKIDLGGEIRLGRQVFGSPRREIVCSFMDPENTRNPVGAVEGTVARSFINWFQAPRDNLELDRLHGTLGSSFDLASVFTWIAGLLNLLAIWDAFEGPAYAYGDEKPEDDDDEDEPGKVKDPKQPEPVPGGAV